MISIHVSSSRNLSSQDWQRFRLLKTGLMFLLGYSESCVITLALGSMVLISLLASVFLILKGLKNSWYGKVGQIYYRLYQSYLCLRRYC